ncbi:hypothetical protein L6164_000993 [Bauhinia variegata]|uniref:Uncharacterized protein n=1 Tax=Bauhinia variegata TaxID=167791 RepID=A0ACB9Q7J8_BAUVA|nr:hypothetical protein L6164_000993 [Bauhinia variegata]
MFLAEISRFPSLFPFRVPKKQTLSDKFDLESSSFDSALLCRLRALDPPSISLDWLSRAVDFLSFVHSEARILISNLNLPDLDDSLACYLNDSVKILDLCNSISSEIERLRHRRLVLNLVIHLLTSSDSDKTGPFPAPEKLKKARDSLSDWGNCSPGFKNRGFLGNLEVLVRDLAAALDKAPPRGKISGVGRLVRRTILAVGYLTVFFAGVLVSEIYGKPELVAVRVPAEFLWADSFNKLKSTISGELKRRFDSETKKGVFCVEEVEDVVIRARETCDVIDDEESADKLNDVVKGLEKGTLAFSCGLDRFSNAVDGMFNTVLCSRKVMLENVRVASK